MGWANHEGLWRSNAPEVAVRLEDVRRFYSASDPRAAREILDRYHVTHVVVGDLERTSFPSADGVGSFPFLRRVRSGTTSVYRYAGTP
jgi:uncharacterized membrane protein